MMTAQYTMSHMDRAASMSCEAAVSFCAAMLDSAIWTESIFVMIIFLLALPLILIV